MDAKDGGWGGRGPGDEGGDDGPEGEGWGLKSGIGDDGGRVVADLDGFLVMARLRAEGLGCTIDGAPGGGDGREEKHEGDEDGASVPHQPLA